MGISNVPSLGSGLGYREPLADETLAASDEIDFIEVLADQYMRRPEDLDSLRHLTETFQVIPHGVGMSIGTMGPIDEDYLAAAVRVSDASGSSFYSDHLCMTRVPGIDLGHLAPLYFSEELLLDTVRKVDLVQERLGKPLVLENVTYMVDIPQQEMTQTEFFWRLTDATGCGILLDLTNLYTNAMNHLFDPVEAMTALPLDRVVYVHLAGGFWRDGVLIDGHSHPVPEEVWTLLADLCSRADIQGVLLEQDQNFHDIRPLLEQVCRARGILRQGTV